MGETEENTHGRDRREHTWERQKRTAHKRDSRAQHITRQNRQNIGMTRRRDRRKKKHTGEAEENSKRDIENRTTHGIDKKKGNHAWERQKRTAHMRENSTAHGRDRR
jgi:hypothetical protein